MVKIRVDYNKLYLIQGKNRFQLESATIHYYPKNEFQYEIIVFILNETSSTHTTRKEFKQKIFENPVNIDFISSKENRNNEEIKYLFASGSKESPTSMNWYINYYKH